jgi:hypothetical protein
MSAKRAIMPAVQNDETRRFASRYQALGLPKQMGTRSLSAAQYICH